MAKKKKASSPDQIPVGTSERNALESGNGTTPDPRERIAARAYELYLQRGASDGRATDDWLEAERELSPSSARHTTK
jgi:Protein of unknown function (DUF2934)